MLQTLFTHIGYRNLYATVNRNSNLSRRFTMKKSLLMFVVLAFAIRQNMLSGSDIQKFSFILALFFKVAF